MSHTPNDTVFDRGVDVDQIANEICALRTAAEAYANACSSNQPNIAGLGIELEYAAVRYADRRAELIATTSRVDYVAIVEAAERERERSGN